MMFCTFGRLVGEKARREWCVDVFVFRKSPGRDSVGMYVFSKACLCCWDMKRRLHSVNTQRDRI